MITQISFQIRECKAAERDAKSELSVRSFTGEMSFVEMVCIYQELTRHCKNERKKQDDEISMLKQQIEFALQVVS